LLAVSRALREGGNTQEARELIGGARSRAAMPDVALEKALNELREGMPEKAFKALEALAAQSPEAGFRLGEARFFAGLPDSALAAYQRVAQDPAAPFTGAALERIYLIEDGTPREALPSFGRLAYERWRGDPKRAMTIADSLYRSLPHSPLWAVAALELASLRDASGDPKLALEPLLAVAETLPDDRLAPSARQRAGDLSFASQGRREGAPAVRGSAARYRNRGTRRK
jgi:tetratricopeptide (TPR) repeat protein